MLTTRAASQHINHRATTLSTFFRPYLKKIFCAIFSAMPEELEFFQKTFAQAKTETIVLQGFEFKLYEYSGKRILFAYTGLGTAFAASVATLIHHHFSPEFILLSGTAGGIKSELKLRDVVIVEKAFEAEIQGAFKLLKNTPFESCLVHPLRNQCFPQVYSADEELLQIASSIDFLGLKVHKGTVVSSNTFPAPPELFHKIKKENPYSIDMETSAFYQIAWLLKARALAIRGISNELNPDGTDDKVHESDVKGSAEAAAKALLKILDALILKYSYQPLQETAMNSVATVEVKELVKRFKLLPHPEGGYYARTFQSTDVIKSMDKDRYDDESRSAGTSIYYLLQGHDFSAWHCLKSDELWHFYTGSSVKIYVIDNQGNLTTHCLGNHLEDSENSFQVAITAGNWFAAEVVDKTAYSLVGCTVNPGFDFKDFKLAEREVLSEEFPQHRALIARFSRVSSEIVLEKDDYSAGRRSRL